MVWRKWRRIKQQQKNRRPTDAVGGAESRDQECNDPAGYWLLQQDTHALPNGLQSHPVLLSRDAYGNSATSPPANCFTSSSHARRVKPVAPVTNYILPGWFRRSCRPDFTLPGRTGRERVKGPGSKSGADIMPVPVMSYADATFLRASITNSTTSGIEATLDTATSLQRTGGERCLLSGFLFLVFLSCVFLGSRSSLG